MFFPFNMYNVPTPVPFFMMAAQHMRNVSDYCESEYGYNTITPEQDYEPETEEPEKINDMFRIRFRKYYE